MGLPACKLTCTTRLRNTEKMIDGLWSWQLPSYGRLLMNTSDKCLIWVVSRMLDSFQLALVGTMIYHYTVTNWGHVEVLLGVPWYFCLRNFFKKLGLNNFQEYGYQCWMWSRLALLRYMSTHTHFFCQTVMASIVQCVFARRVWLCESFSLSPLEHSVCSLIVINLVSRKNWALTGAIVRFPWTSISLI